MNRSGQLAIDKRSRRAFLRAAGLGGLGGLVAACSSPAAAPAEPVAQVVEVTRVVERIVEITRVVPAETPVPETPEEEGMILYVDIEHPDALADPARQPGFDSVRKQRTQVCGSAAGMASESILYTDLTPEVAREKDVRALVISGNTTDWEAYDFKTFEPLFEIIRTGEMPTIGLCGGHQLIGLMYGAKCDAIRKLKADEVDPGGFAPGWFKEVGFLPVTVVQDDPLFEGLGSTPVFFESHYWEIKAAPPEFDVLANTPDVKVQVIKHREYPIYGTQFHPEVNNAQYRDGYALLKNFFKITLGTGGA